MARKAYAAVFISDHVLLCDMLRVILKELHIAVTGAFTSVTPGETFVIASRPDLLMIDMMMPTLRTFEGAVVDFTNPGVLMDCTASFEAVDRVSQQSPETKIVMVTGERHPHNFESGLKHGAHGIVSKIDSLEELFKIVRRVLAGERRVLSARMQALVDEYLQSPFPDLTDVEKNILELVQFGMECREIGRRLGYATSTVRNTLAAINQKLGTKNRNHAVEMALELGLIGWGDNG